MNMTKEIDLFKEIKKIILTPKDEHGRNYFQEIANHYHNGGDDSYITTAIFTRWIDIKFTTDEYIPDDDIYDGMKRLLTSSDIPTDFILEENAWDLRLRTKEGNYTLTIHTTDNHYYITEIFNAL